MSNSALNGEVNTASTVRIKRKMRRFNQVMTPYLFVAPFIISFCMFFIYPVISTITMSFQKIEGINSVTFVGLDNYKKLLNPDFYMALKTSTLYTFWTILLLIPIPIMLAVVLNNKKIRGRNFFKSALFVPGLTSVVVAGIFFRFTFGEMENSIMNVVARFFGISPQPWLLQYSTAMVALVLVALWRWTGINIVYFLSGLQNISTELYEAADIDGANTVQKFLNVTLPGLRPVIIYVLTISVYGGFAMVSESLIFWGGNPPGGIGLTIVRYIYQAGFNYNDLGFASTIGIALLLIVMLVNLVQLTLFGLFKKESD